MRPLLTLAAAVAAACPSLAPALASAEPMPAMPGMAGMSASPPAPPAASPPDRPPATGMGEMDGMAGMDMSHASGALGGYAPTRDASGTAWQPDAARHEGLHRRVGAWSVMIHGHATLVYDAQGGRRGDDETFVVSHLMILASRPLAGGTLTLRALGSLDPLMGKSGYPLLLQTGETADGRTPLVDRQHPHDLIGELALAYSRPLGGGVSAFVYGGPAGEPALGPVAYLHRLPGMADPETPISHHWLDSTHTSFGVATAGLVHGGVKLEASSFTGREPNQHRWDIDHPRFDSWAVRATWNPGPDWSVEVSRGHLVSPEQLTPTVNQDRTIASATYDWPMRGGEWQTTFACGRDENRPGTTTDAFLLESALVRGPRTLFGRAERVGKDELFGRDPGNPLAGRTFEVGKLSVGYSYTLPIARDLALDLGGLVSRYDLPGALQPAYGRDPTSLMLFARVKLR